MEGDMRGIVWVLALSLAAGCGGQSGTSSGASEPRPVRGSANVISEQEIAQGTYQTALEIVQSLRPQMTRYRATTTSAPRGGTGLSEATAVAGSVVVYMDETRLGEVSALSTIPAQRVREIRYISANDATTRWGTGHNNGVIQVVMKK
jgi:hypothetical protein